MKPRTATEKALPPGYTVRLALEDKQTFEQLAALYQSRSMNQLLANLVYSIIQLCRTTSLPDWSILKMSKGSGGSLWSRLANSDLRRTLSNSLTVPIKITFPKETRKDLAVMAQRLRWAEGQFVLEALQAACQLAASEKAVEIVPDIIDLYLGREVNAEAIPFRPPGQIMGELSRALGLIGVTPRLAQNPVDQPMINSLFSELDNYVPEDQPGQT